MLVKGSRVAGLQALAARLVADRLTGPDDRAGVGGAACTVDLVSTDVGAEDALPNHSMASLARNGAAAYGDSVAAMFLRDGGWQSLTYDELWQRVREVALGLVALGVERGDRVGVLANTRVEFDRRRPRRQRRRGDRRAGVPDRTPPTSASGWSATRGAASIVCEDAGAGGQDRRGARPTCPTSSTSSSSTATSPGR